MRVYHVFYLDLANYDKAYTKIRQFNKETLRAHIIDIT
jgi:hypothetical protein